MTEAQGDCRILRMQGSCRSSLAIWMWETSNLSPRPRGSARAEARLFARWATLPARRNPFYIMLLNHYRQNRLMQANSQTSLIIQGLRQNSGFKDLSKNPANAASRSILRVPGRSHSGLPCQHERDHAPRLRNFRPVSSSGGGRACLVRALPRREGGLLDGYDLAAGRSRLAMRIIPFGCIAKQALDKAWYASHLRKPPPWPRRSGYATVEMRARAGFLMGRQRAYDHDTRSPTISAASSGVRYQGRSSNRPTCHHKWRPRPFIAACSRNE